MFQRGEWVMSTQAQTVLKSVIEGLNIRRAVQAASARRAQRKALREALAWAYTVSARDYYPKWASYLLDQALGERHLRDCYLRGGACLNPTELAEFWADQLGGWWMKQRHVSELVPVASRFLRTLEAELCGNPQFQTRLDCATP
jgi:hypothetical protein